MRYSLAYDYGVIGNHFSSALVSRHGSVDWCCLPYLDSPCHFGAYLDKNRGGRFQISPQGEFRSEQRYIPNTQVLETFFETPMGNGIVTDWMPIENRNFEGPTLHRQVQVVEGKVNWTMTCTPRFKYGEEQAQAEKHPFGILFRGTRIEDIALLQGTSSMEISANGSSAISRFELQAGQTSNFAWAWGRRTAPSHAQLQLTIDYWKSIAHKCPVSGCIFGGPWHELVIRSGLTLQLLTTAYASSVAEGVAILLNDPAQGNQTWGNRYAAIRDGGWIIQALANLGYTKEAKAHFLWISEVLERDGVEGLQPVYTLDGGKILPYESDPPYWNNLSGSRRFQLDIYGHVVIAANEYFKIFGELPSGVWPRLMELADYVCQAWKRPDHGPGGKSQRAEHFVISKIFCWAALDQTCQLAMALREAPSPRWISERAILHKTICEQGYDPLRNSFVRSFGDREIDASHLWIPILNFLPTEDLRVRGTIDRINSELSTGVLLKRPSVQDDAPDEGIDLWSSFLFITYLALSGQVDEASDRMAELSSYASALGLFDDRAHSTHLASFSECFPSSSVHFSLINAALYIGWAKGRYKPLTQLIGRSDLNILGKTA